MTGLNKQPRQLTTFVLYFMILLYFCLLTTMLLFGFSTPIGGYRGIRGGYRSLNLIPFRSINSYLFHCNFKWAVNNLLGNIAVFVPLGVYVTLLRKNKGVLKNLLFVFLTSSSFEILQYVFARGSSDIDDVILNCLGGLIGIWLYKGLVWRLGVDKTRGVTAVVSAVVGLPMAAVVLAGLLR